MDCPQNKSIRHDTAHINLGLRDSAIKERHENGRKGCGWQQPCLYLHGWRGYFCYRKGIKCVKS